MPLPDVLGKWELACLLAWSLVQTQVELSPWTGAVLRLRYEAIQPVLELEGLWCPEVMRGLRLIEVELLSHKKAVVPTMTQKATGRSWRF